MVAFVARPVRVHRPAIEAILGCLVASAASLALAPALMPESYSWVSHTTSESAAQGVDGAWLARIGFLIFGLGVLALGRICSASWGRLAAASHAVFGISMIATAAFSSRSWEPGMPFDQTEDLLHSAAATLMAVAFSVGVLAITIRRARERLPARPLDLLAIAVSVMISIGMAIWGDIAGALQRTMFLVLYAWYASEAIRAYRLEKVTQGE
jgi:uncharacterized membrane protein YhaH (DUF805 family)